jgi:hypothetical protein
MGDLEKLQHLVGLGADLRFFLADAAGMNQA